MSESFAIFSRDNMLVANCSQRQLCVLSSRRLVIGKLNSKEILIGLWVAPMVTVGQIKAVLRLKPPSSRMSPPATVVRVLPTTWTHRDSLKAGY